MELIFGFLPLPVAIAVLAVTGVGAVLIKRFAKSNSVKAIADQVAISVVTKKRVDQTVEAVLAVLKVDVQLADKIGDLVAEIVTEIVGVKGSLTSKVQTVSRLVAQDETILPAVALKAVSGPTPLNNLIVDKGDPSIIADVHTRALVAEGVIRQYAQHVEK